MQKSIVYFLIALTMLSLCLCLVPTAHSKTENIKIVSYTWYTDQLGFLDVVGEVQNNGSSTVASVLLGGTAITNIGNPTSTTMVWVQNLAPQQKAPFYMEFMLTSSSDQSSQVTVTPQVSNVMIAVTTADETTNYQYPNLKITSQTHSIGTTAADQGVYWITGTLQNTGSQTAKNVRVLGTFYNSAGTVIAVGGYTGTDVVTASLAPSATTNFKFGAYDMNQTGLSADKKIASYSLLTQAEEPVMQGTAPTITPYPTGSTSPSGTTSPTSPSDTQSSDSGNNDSTSNTTGSSTPGWIYAVAIIVVLAVIAGAVVAFRKRKPDEEPKKPTKKPATKKATKKTTPKRMTETSLTLFSKPQTQPTRKCAIV